MVARCENVLRDTEFQLSRDVRRARAESRLAKTRLRRVECGIHERGEYIRGRGSVSELTTLRNRATVAALFDKHLSFIYPTESAPFLRDLHDAWAFFACTRTCEHNSARETSRRRSRRPVLHLTRMKLISLPTASRRRRKRNEIEVISRSESVLLAIIRFSICDAIKRSRVAHEVRNIF